MKKKYLLMGLVGLMALTAGTSCTHDLEETNIDPNYMNVGDLHDPWGIFEPMFYGAAKGPCTYYTWFWNDELAQYTCFSGGTTREENRYKIGESNFSALWSNYSGYANDAQHMIDLAVKYKVPDAQALGMIMKVMFMENLTDIYGDIPYKEAFKGRGADQIMQPKFESQQEVYEDMLADLDSANDILAKAKPEVDETLKPMDQMYAGSTFKWRKFCNSLRLRLLCRVSGRAEMNSGARIQQMLDNPEKYPIFSSNEDNATVKWSGIDPFRSYFAGNNTLEGTFTKSSYHVAEQVIKMTVFVDSTGIQSYTDPRLPIWANVGEDGWKGAISGCSPADRDKSNDGAATLNYPVFVRNEAHTYFMDYAEVQFILAEMAERGLISGGEEAARAYYEAGVTASLKKWGEWGQYSKSPKEITDEDVATYLASSLGNWDASDNKLELIGNQKYLALFWTGMEAFAEVRRTGYPQLTIGNGTDYNDYQYPQRFAYPNVTVANNRQNVEEALQRMGGENTMKTPVWWSKQAITGKLLFEYKGE